MSVLLKPLKLNLSFGLGYIKEVDALACPQKYSQCFNFGKTGSGVGVRDLNTKRFLIKNGLAAKS